MCTYAVFLDSFQESFQCLEMFQPSWKIVESFPLDEMLLRANSPSKFCLLRNQLIKLKFVVLIFTLKISTAGDEELLEILALI
jgi:hypothetical protein